MECKHLGRVGDGFLNYGIWIHCIFLSNFKDHIPNKLLQPVEMFIYHTNHTMKEKKGGGGGWEDKISPSQVP